jgi:phenylpyruvate tautomerase PptA (4-oxalocrotonate tautomerase family)
MPIVTLRALRPPESGRIEAAMALVVQGLSAALGCEPGDVWVHWEEMAAVRQGTAERVFAGHCPVVTIRALTAPADDGASRGVEAVAHAVALGLGVPLEDVWVHWEELRRGRVFAGGALR